MPTFDMILLAALQALILAALAPVMTGFSRAMRSKMHSRRGPGIFQDYRDIFKLLRRQDIAPASSGLVFRVMPTIQCVTMLIAATALPVVTLHSPMGIASDLITFIYLFALARFFFALAGIDSGSTFAGIGGVRELTLAVLVEPIMILSLMVVALIEGSTNLGAISTAIATGQVHAPVAVLLAMVAFGFSAFIEMGKLPFDMAEAEQELQEGPLTEYSGASLGLLKWGLGLKKVVVAQFFLGVFIPFGNAGSWDASALLLAVVLFPIKLFVVFFLAALVENSVARGRFLLTSQTTWVGFGIASLAFVFYLAGL